MEEFPWRSYFDCFRPLSLFQRTCKKQATEKSMDVIRRNFVQMINLDAYSVIPKNETDFWVGLRALFCGCVAVNSKAALVNWSLSFNLNFPNFNYCRI